jgi:prepilin-type N-terminal cleavage/methylation domain-containing protein
MRLRPESRCAGFTLVELVSVIVLLGILAVFAAPRFNVDAFSSRSNLDTARSILSYGQKIAIAQHRPVFVVFGGGSAGLCFDAACSARVLTPSNTPAVLPAGTAGPNFSFNALGQASGAGVIIITLPDGSTIPIQSETGYVQ